MNPLEKFLRIMLIVLTLFLSLTAILGGAALMANFYAPPAESLHGLFFNSFIIPGIALSLVVGGSALAAAILLIRRSKFGNLFAAAAGVIIMFFEFVEVLVIGSPAGASQFMQIFYVGLGTLIEIAAMGGWFFSIIGKSN